MGCDIHLFIEYKSPGLTRWISFGRDMDLDRHYELFAHLAGVRSGGIEPVVQPRGRVPDPAYQSQDTDRKYISESESEGTVSPANAQRWVDSGSSEYIDIDGRHVWVTHPDWHTHTWLTPDEFEKALDLGHAGVGYRAVLAALRCFEQAGCDARVVLWFDN